MNEQQTAAMRQALEWIEAQPEPRMIGAMKAITALRQALEPVQMRPATREEKVVRPGIYQVKVEQQPADEPVHEFAYKAITKYGQECHFGTHGSAKVWAGEGGTVETIKLRNLQLVEVAETRPQPAAWVGLTDEEYAEAEKCVWAVVSMDDTELKANREFYCAIEAKLKEKNT